jgi:peptidoglycan hydrolase-like protein with peptidoglycan-binding domain
MEILAYIHHTSEYEAGFALNEQKVESELDGLLRQKQGKRRCRIHYLISLALFPFMCLGLSGVAWALQYGDEGQDVMELQRRLKSQGYLDVGLPEGVYRELTEDAVFRFQEDNKLQVDGIAGSETMTVLGLSESAFVPISRAETSEINISRNTKSSPSMTSESINSSPYRRLDGTPSTILATVPPFNPREQNLIVNLVPTFSATVFLRSKDDSFQKDWQNCLGYFKQTITKDEIIDYPSNNLSGAQKTEESHRTGCLQKALIKLGYLDSRYSSHKDDSVYDLDTESSVREFQKNKGITVDGKAGSETLSEIINDSFYSEERVVNQGILGFLGITR